MKDSQSKKVLFIAQAAMIAAIYVVLTIVFAPFSYGEVQVRISEALTILPVFTPCCHPGAVYRMPDQQHLWRLYSAGHYFWQSCHFDWRRLYMAAAPQKQISCPTASDSC